MNNGCYLLGISSYFHDSAAALVCGDQIVAAAQEERFTRVKADWNFPKNAIGWCLGQLPPGAELTGVAYYENPGLKTSRILRNAAAHAPRGGSLWPRTVKTLKTLAGDLPAQLLAVCPDPDKLWFVPHHRSHAASAFYPSPFNRAGVLVLDGVGEWSTTTLWHGQGDGLSATGEIAFPHSLGLFYSAFTQYCGFKVNSGEYKLMGLAPFGTPALAGRIRDELIDLRSDGSFALNMDYFDFPTRLSTTNPLFERLFGRLARRPGEPVDQYFMNVAASAQRILEEAVIALARATLKRSGARDLCMAGGVALNCVANRRVLQEVPGLERLWIQPASGDAGGALGAALDLARQRGPRNSPRAKTGDAMAGGLLGPEYDEAAIRGALEAAGLVWERPGSDAAVCETVAAGLAEGQIVGHFSGRMEFGPRALGNRSILADPRAKQALMRVNRRIKFREDWRPFAPIVLAEEAATYFEPPTDSPYMLLVSDLKPGYRGRMTLAKARGQGQHRPIDLQRAVNSRFAAVTHVDFSARLQTLARGAGTRARAILEAFHAATGCPMLLNTSFNVRGEPIVCTPGDAVACFLNTHLDMLAIGPFILRKADQPEAARDRVGEARFNAD